MARSRYSLREQLLTLAQSMTQKEIARALGISERTVRRWKNEGVEPNRAIRRVQRAEGKLQRSFEREHKRVAEKLRRDRRKHRGAPRIEKKLRVIPPGTRRQLRVYRRGRDTGKFRPSEWIGYKVEALNFREIFEVVRALRDEGHVVQLIYRIPKGSRYPDDKNGRPGRVVKESTRAVSPPLDLSNLDDNDLTEFLLRYVDAEPTPKSRKLIYVSALDKKPRND